MSVSISPSSVAAAKRVGPCERSIGGGLAEPIDLKVVHSASEAKRPVALLIEGRPLIRDCLERCILRAYEVELRTVATVDEALALIRPGKVDLAVLIVDGPAAAEGNLKHISRLVECDGAAPTIVVADGNDLGEIVRVMKAGARGYISTNMPLDVAIEAIKLVRAGGQFLPATSVLDGSYSPPPEETAQPGDALQRIFTARQAAVVEALRKGMANKIIAYELNMQESTVKVHVRNIMKKLKARNRTEVAYLASRLIG